MIYLEDQFVITSSKTELCWYFHNLHWFSSQINKMKKKVRNQLKQSKSSCSECEIIWNVKIALQLMNIPLYTQAVTA